LRFIDPDGRFSTHTDSSENVVGVINDGDLGVYKHNGDASDTYSEIKDTHSKTNTAAGGKKMGETEYWDEFINPDTHLVDSTQMPK